MTTTHYWTRLCPSPEKGCRNVGILTSQMTIRRLHRHWEQRCFPVPPWMSCCILSSTESLEIMTRIGRLTAQLGITVVLAITLSFALPVFVDRADYTRAVSNYAKNPSSDNDEILRVESAKNHRAVLRTHVATTGLLFLMLNAVCFFIGRWSGKSSKSA